METLFLLCAVIGGTFLVCQFVLTLVGMGDHGHGFDHPAGGDAGHDFAAHSGNHTADGQHQTADGHDSTWIFGVITFRTVVAAVAFFGLAGKAGSAAGLEPQVVLPIALGCGAAAMYGVYFMMRSLHAFNTDGTVRIERAVGKSGRVYLPIPEHNSGAGKIHLKLQNRLVEYQATTSHERLPSGASVVVVGVVGPDTVEVEAATEAEREDHV